jgi:hypothetical protein
VTGRPQARNLLSLGLTGVALILEPTFGVRAILARVAALGADRLSSSEFDALWTESASLSERIAALEAAEVPTIRLQGPALQVLISTLETEAASVFEYADANDVIEHWGLSAQEYAEGAQELEQLGLVTIHPNGNHASGIGRTILEPSVILSVAPTFLEGVDVSREIEDILSILDSGPEGRRQSKEIQSATNIPLARFDLYLRALDALDCITRSGPGSDEYGSSMFVDIKPAGRRIVRGDDPNPAG